MQRSIVSISIVSSLVCFLVLLNGHTASPPQSSSQLKFSSSISKNCSLQFSQNQQPLKFSGIAGYPTLAFSPDSRFLAIANDSGGSGIIIWDLITQNSRNILPNAWGGQLKFSPDGKWLVVGFRSGSVLLANLVSHNSIQLIGHQRGINAISFSPDGQNIGTTSADNTARIWNLTGKNVAILPGIPEAKFGDAGERSPSVSHASWSAEGHFLFIASGRHIKIWQLLDKKLSTLNNYQGGITDATFSPDGKLIAASSKDGTSRVWNLFGHQLAVLSGHTDWVTKITFSPDSQKLLTVSEDKTARLWDIKGRMLTIFRGHEDTVNNAGFSPDGQCIFTSSQDNTVRIWDISGQEITRLPGSFVMALSPNGQYLATSDSDNTVLVWKLY